MAMAKRLTTKNCSGGGKKCSKACINPDMVCVIELRETMRLLLNRFRSVLRKRKREKYKDEEQGLAPKYYTRDLGGGSLPSDVLEVGRRVAQARDRQQIEVVREIGTQGGGARATRG